MSGFFILSVTDTNGVIKMDLGGPNNNDRVVITALETGIALADPANINHTAARVVGAVGFSVEIQVGLLRKARDGIDALLAQLTV